MQSKILSQDSGFDERRAMSGTSGLTTSSKDGENNHGKTVEADLPQTTYRTDADYGPKSGNTDSSPLQDKAMDAMDFDYAAHEGTSVNVLIQEPETLHPHF